MKDITDSDSTLISHRDQWCPQHILLRGIFSPFVSLTVLCLYAHTPPLALPFLPSDQMLLECQDQHDRCLETCVKLAITRNLQARLFSPVVLGELMEVEERARKAGLLSGREETTE